MKFTWYTTFFFLILIISFGNCGQTDQFLASQNYHGYSQDLLFQIIEKHYPQSTGNRKTLLKVLEFDDVQKTLRDAAVEEAAKKLESRSLNRQMDEPLDDPSYCGYYYLSWLPWLDCPQGSREISSLLFSDDICTPRKI